MNTLTEQLPEQVIISRGCHDCPLAEYNENTCSLNMDDIDGIRYFQARKKRHPRCVLLSKSIKVVI